MTGVSEMVELAERVDRFRAWMFGRYWFFGPISIALALFAFVLRRASGGQHD